MVWQQPFTSSEIETDIKIQCDACDHITFGYQMGELMVKYGWRLYSTGDFKPLFVVCGDCVAIYEKRRQHRAAG